MSSPRLLPAKQVVVGLVAASVLAAGLTLGIEHAAGGRSVSLVPAAVGSSSSSSSTEGRPAFGRPGFGLGGVDAGAVIGIFTKDTGLTPQQVIAGIQGGKTLDDLAGSNAGKVKADYLAQIKTGLDQAVTKGVITAGGETSLLNDAKDAIDQLFLAHLDKAGLGALPFGAPGKGFPGFHQPKGGSSSSSSSTTSGV